jgi:hypothetical protein
MSMVLRPDADGVFPCRPVSANRGDEKSNQFVHLPPNSAPQLRTISLCICHMAN